MNFKKTWKRFWTLNRHHAEGFTLVELIVVIAILAILSAVAIPAYSGYVEKTNKTADMQLFSQVDRALQLAYYSEPNFVSGYVVLSPEGTTIPGIDPASNHPWAVAMNNAFGQGWANNVKLKYTEWNSEYQNSSFSGNESALLGQVDTLTGALSGALQSNMGLVGEGFSSFLSANGVGTDDPELMADAAVLYVAQSTSGVSEAQKNNYLNAVGSFRGDATGLMGTCMDSFGTVGGMAASYAFAEAYFQYQAEKNGDSAGLDALHNAFEGQPTVGSAGEAINILNNAITEAMGTVDNDLFNEYMRDQAVKDAEAYLNIMNTVSSASGQLMDEIKNGQGQSFASNAVISGLLDNYAEGGVVIQAVVVDGKLVITNSALAEE